MKFENGNVQDLQIAYIGGGSRGWAWGFMMDLAADAQMEGTVRLYDIDQAAAENNRIIGGRISAHKDAASRWKYEAAPSLKAALTGADFVVISILPGTFAEMRSDVHGPERLGVWQPVGDTVGPGGFVRALRTIPMYVTIAEAIRDCAPEAWVVNYTNPMTLCMRTLYEIFPQIRAFGCCHEVFNTQNVLCEMLADLRGIKGVTRQQINVNVLGINHFTWFDSASYEDMDLFPLYRVLVDKHYDSGFPADDSWKESVFKSGQRVSFDLFRRYGLIAAAGDRHLAEFAATPYLKNPKTVAEWKFGLTSVDWREQNLAERLARRRALVSGEEPIELKPSGEEGHLLIKALLGLSDIVSNVNLPNRGQIENLPLEAVVETNALFRRGEIRPVFAGALPGNVHALTVRHAANQENTLKAALACDYKLALSTFLNDPLMAAVSPVDGEGLLGEMLRKTEEYLPEGWAACPAFAGGGMNPPPTCPPIVHFPTENGGRLRAI